MLTFFLLSLLLLLSSVFLLKEKRRAHAALHPRGEHHHAELCVMGSGGGDGLHRPRAVHQRARDESTERNAAFQDAKGSRETGVQK